MSVVDFKVTLLQPPAVPARSKLRALTRVLLKNAGIALSATLISTATWAACSGVVLDVGYDFDLGAKTGIAPADAGTCTPGATTAPAGDDYCAGNTAGIATGDYVIRTNDSGAATLKYTFNAGTKRDDYVIVVDIPKTGDAGATSTRPAGLTIATWTGLPSACSGPTSAITNGGTRLTCDLGTIDRSVSGQITVAVSAPYKASARALNGETFKIVATQQASGGSTGGSPGTPSACTVGPADTVAPTLTISARPKIDIKTSAYTYSPVRRFGSPGAEESGYDVSYFVYVDGLNNATVGGEAVASPLNFNVGLSANIPTPGVRFVQLADYYGNTTNTVPTTAVYGDPAGNGILIPVTLTPSPATPDCALEFLVPGGACRELPLAVPQRLSTHYITYFVPITAFGAASQIDFNNFINSDGAASGTPISTPPASAVGSFSEPINENNAPYTIVKVLPGTYAKYTSQFAETRTERPPGSPAGFPQTLNELGGFNWCAGGDCKQYPTKNVESLIILGNRSSTEWNSTNGFNGVGAIVCDKFDNRGMVLTRKPRSAGSAAYEFPTNDSGDPVGATRVYQQAGTIPSGYTLEVATAAGTPPGGAYPPNSQNCGDADAAWVSTSGITDFSAYNLVRMKVPVVKTPFDSGSDGYLSMVFFFTVPLTAPNGAYIGNQLKVQSPEDFASTGLGSWSPGVFNPINNQGVYTGERFQVVKALVRTGKEAYDRFGNITTIMGAGKTVTYQLTPSYTAAPGVPSPNSNIEVVDVLPIPLTYVIGSARSGTPSVSLEPNTITVDGSGRQVLTWVLPNVVLNSTIPPIYFDVKAPEVLPAGTVLTNKVTVAAPLVDQSTDAERSAVKAVTVDNVAGLFVNKSISTPIIPRNGTYSFTLDVGNLKSTAENNIDIIDVLPRSGSVISSPVSNFAGTNVLSGPITPPVNGTVYYTNAAPGAAPIALHSAIPASSNALPVAADYGIAPTAANGWCTAAEITAATAGCPASIAAATAFRVQVSTIAGNALLQVVVPMTTNGNAENNVYVNRFSAQGASLPALFSNDVLTVVKQGKISGKVFVDTNLNSQPTAGEPSIAGVTVTLTGIDSNGNLVTKTTTTDVNGDYQFSDLFPGTYNLTETQPTAYGSAGANVAGSAGGTVPNPDSFTGIPMVVGQNANNYNFGEIGSTIAGKVCEDLNNDGKCQAGEPPIAGTLITLTGTDSGGNTVNRTATTTATGDWKISDLPNPNATGFTLTETQPAGYLDGKQSPGVLTPVAGGPDAGANIGTTTATVTGNDTITGIKFTQGTNGTTYDFAEVKPASLQGFVYYDTNTDGARAPTEPGIVGVTLELTGTDDMGQPVALTTTTSITPDGSYTFSNLRPGSYTVREIQPVAPTYSLVDGTVTVGSVAYTVQPVVPAANNGALTTETPSTVSGSGEGVSGIVLGSGGNGTNYNFGEVPLVPISGTVFVDKNFGGTLDVGTETGLPNSGITTLTLCRTATEPCPPADTVATTTSTPGSGTYTFPPQPSGSYFVVETQPAGYGSSSPNIQPVTLVTTPVTNINFAETGARISGTVYADNNADGALQVGTDPGIATAIVKLCLTSSLPACATPIATTTTSSTGTYAFTDVPAPPAGQTYTILEDEGSAPLTSYTNGTSTLGTLVGGTSMVNGTVPPAEQGPAFAGNSTIGAINFVMPTAVVTGTPPVVGTGYNFGELPVAGISGRVFVDRDFTNGPTGAYNPLTDGTLLNNATATITLCSVDPAATGGVCPVASVVATTSTAADGTYNFPVVPAGNFWVVETQPAGYGSSSPNVVPVIRTGADPVVNVNFAETLAVLNGRVYRDDDASGTDTAGETGIGNVTVKLCLSSDPTCATPVATTLTTATSGTYTFADVLAPAAGVSYFIKEEQSTVPATLQNGTTTVGLLSVSGGAAAPVGAANSANNTINNITWTPSASVVNALQAVGTVYNFGELPISNISGRVFVDRDFTNGTTGTYNPATDGTLVNNATTTVTLCSVDPAATGGVCPVASVVGTTTTAADGTYNFINVPPGNYWVVETQPQGYGSSSPNVVPVTRTGTTPVSNVNFADTLAEIKGTVYKDDNANGVLNPADPGIGGVTVKLCLSSDVACATPVQTTTTTPTSGTYTFANLPAPPAGQTYFIKEEQSTVPAGLLNGTTTVGQLTVGVGAPAPVGAANSPASTINAITWTPDSALVNAPAAVGADYNFGEVPTTTVSGAVILDKDFTGTSTPGDTGLPATATVTLCRSAPAAGQPCAPADTVANTTTTPGSGTYTFPAVTPGTYYVVETQPVGYASSSPNTSAPVVVATVPVTGVNFYETGASLGGFVYKDTNLNGVKDATGDIPLPNVTVRLCTTNNCATGSVVATAATSATGAYQFNDLPAPPVGQQYFIVEDQATVPPTPTVLSDGTTTVGAFTLTGSGGSSVAGTPVQTPSRVDGINWVPPTSVQTGVAAVVGTNFNFGEIDGFDIGGQVFLDKNRDGVLNPATDTPLATVTLTLCSVATVPCPPTNVVGTTTTDITGNYTFPKVPPGSYFVQETQPAGYGSSPSSPNVRPVTVVGAPITGINFADTLSSITGLVYRDDNGSQTRDGVESTMPAGITITLTGVDASGATVNLTTVTSATGTYAFDNLRTGTYTITESQPTNFGTGGSNPGTLAGGTGAPNSNVISNIVLPVNTDAPNYNFGDTPQTAGVSGTVWRDSDHDNQRDAGEPPLVGWTVQVLRTPPGGGTPTVVTSVQTGSNGDYSVTGLEAGGGYSIRFIAPGGAVFGGAVDGEQGTPVSGATIVRGEISSLTLTASVTGGPNTVPQQSLPVDPSGVVYDSDTRLPVPGAVVTLVPVACPAFNPATDLVGGTANLAQTVGADGIYQFLLNPSAPTCQYRLVVTPPATYALDPAIPPQPGAYTPGNRPPNTVDQIVPNATAPTAGQPTTYFLAFNLNNNSRDVVNNHIPLIAGNRPVLFITKVAGKAKVELGDTVKYTVRVRYAGGAANLPVLNVVDTMPAGFKLIAETSYVSVPLGAPAVLLPVSRIAGAPGAVVTYNIPLPAGGFAPGSEIELTYRVRVAVGSMQGDGINRAQARSIGVIRSNTAQAKVIVDPGVFTNDGCVAGKVFVDCNNNHIQDAEEIGVPGVRMYMEDGTYFITDSEGKYSYCGISPKSHVISVDMLTMPRGSRMTTTSNRNLGDGNSIFLDTKNGQLIRADFAEGSCSNTVLEQVKRRRTQGEVRTTETEKTGQPALKFEGKSPQYPQQGTDSANQPLVVPRSTNGGTPSVPEQNTPVPQMPGASSNTQGANVRNAK